MQITELSEFEQFESVTGLQRAIWGMADLDVVSPNLLRVYCDKKARWGILLGAWEASHLAGFLFCLPTGHVDTLWMDLVGVLPAYQGQGIGRRLMEHLATLARGRGIRKVLWTYDPLEAVNANLYIGKIGAVCRVYEEDYYRFAPTRIEAGVPADRFKMEWHLDATERAGRVAVDEQDCLRVAIPGDFRTLKQRSPEQALQWRERTRPQFRRINTEQYAVVGFEYDRVRQAGEYLLCRSSEQAVSRVT